MGYKFEIHVWKQIQLLPGTNPMYRYILKWEGSFLLVAIWKMYQFKKIYSCVKLEWR